MDEVELNEFKVVFNESKLINDLKNRFNEFNIFEALNAIDIENIHRNFLIWILNPFETHNIGDLFLKKLLIKSLETNYSKFNIINDVNSWDFQDLELIREKYVRDINWNKRFIDIFLFSEKLSFTWVIELKTKTGEHSDQLNQYQIAIDSDYNRVKNRIYSYLTIDGIIPKNKSYNSLSYEDLKVTLEEVLAEKESNEIYKSNNQAHLFIQHYINMIGRHYMKDTELKRLSRKFYLENKNIFDYISKNKNHQIDVQPLICELINSENQLRIEQKNNMLFIPREMDDIIPRKGKGWTTENRLLLFEIKNYPKEIHFDLVLGPGEINERNKIISFTKKRDQVFKRVNFYKDDPDWRLIHRSRTINKIRYDLDLIEDHIRSIFSEFMIELMNINDIFKNEYN